MGKYDNMFIDIQSSNEIIAVDNNSNMLVHIANELAEMNRLKQLEILHNQPKNIIYDDDYNEVHVTELTLSELDGRI